MPYDIEEFIGWTPPSKRRLGPGGKLRLIQLPWEGNECPDIPSDYEAILGLMQTLAEGLGAPHVIREGILHPRRARNSRPRRSSREP